MTTFETIGALALAGTLVSLLVQFLKARYGGGSMTMLILVIISIVLGTAYYFIASHAHLLETIISIAISANAVYNFVIQWFEKPKVDSEFSY